MVQNSKVNGTDLGAQEWRDILFLRYVLEPSELPKYCDRCNAKIHLFHALNCNRGGLVTVRHNDLRDGVPDLAGKCFTTSHVCDDPHIFAGYAVKMPKAKPSGTRGSTDQDGAQLPEAAEKKGDLLIRDLWRNGTNSVQDMCFVNTDAKSHSGKTPEKCLHEAERGKKWM